MPGHPMARHARRRTGVVGVVGAGALLTAVIATDGWAFQDSPPAGLAGILPTEVPDGLTADDFNVLGPNWEAWAQETAGIVETLYETENPDLAAQQATLAQLRVQVGTIAAALSDPQHKEIHSQLTGLHGRLVRRVDLAEALLATITEDPQVARSRRLNSAYARLTSTIEVLRADLNNVSGGSAWLRYVRADELAAAAAGSDTADETIRTLTSVQRKVDGRNSLSDASQQEFLGRRSFLELSGAIGDVLTANAWQPAANQAAIVREQATALVAALETYEVDGGDAAAAEINTAYQAIGAAASDGGERISVVMRQYFFGHNIRLIASEGFCRKVVTDNRIEQRYHREPASQDWVVSVDLQPSNGAVRYDLRITGTVTTTTPNAEKAADEGGSTETFVATRPATFDGRGVVLGDVEVDTIASAVEEVKRQVYSETDSRYEEVSPLAVEAKVLGPLRELGWNPDSIQPYSTSDELIFLARLMDPFEMGAAAPAFNPALPRNGLAIQIHESALNNAVDRLELAGKTMTDEELRAMLEERISKLLGREFIFAPTEVVAAEAEADGGQNTYVFDTHDPLRFRVDNGSITIAMRTGLAREGGDPVPLHIIEVPLGVSVREDRILLGRQGSVRILPGPDTPRSIPRQNILRANIQRSIPDRQFNASIDIKRGRQTITFKVTSIEAQDGWITVLAK